MGKQRSASTWGHVRLERVPSSPIGVWIHLMRYNETKKSSLPKQKAKRVV